ncbi:HlyD family type I secretion periplasmic adaptor subunit [uncultured Rhodoferax sp.]|uniref:HlyD family type I secretion periplasmic adaptor subunit n=1 Tax=uncultured Rhodoferax sp. TaxID=223188 RepID=UPI0025F8FE1E|nr:HlyD family type I secretion periplasmic adaptor subunit [uncultured Rhodoferax sp.]
MSKWFKSSRGKTVIEYLPDADELERSPVPRWAQITLRVLLLAVFSFGAWASISELDQVVVARGSLINPLPNVVVQPLETSIVQSVDVRIGQLVKKGDPLATLDATFIQADENVLRLRLDSLETQAKGLEEELAGKVAAKPKTGSSEDDVLQANLVNERRANYRAQQQRIAESVGRLRAALAANRRDQKLAAARLASLKNIETMQEKMVAQKFGAPLQLMEAQIKSKEVERDLEAVTNREQELVRELAAAEAESVAFEKGWRQKAMEDLLSVTRERDAVREQIQKADKRHRLVTLAAPMDAVVLDIAKFSPGSIVREAETFFTLVPLNAQLEAEVQIDSADIGYVKAGAEARLKLDAFPFQRHGTMGAKIRTISEDAFRRDSASKGNGEVYYLSRLTLDGVALKNMVESSRLMPGMTLSAEVIVGKRTVLSYLAWPLTKGLGEAAREP